MHVLLTGGAGFIGSHIAAELLSAGATVSIVDDLSSGSMSNLPSGLGGAVLLKRVAQCHAAELPAGVDVLIHLAAKPSVQGSWTHAIEAHENNLTETLRVLQWCRERSIRRVVYASSAAVYGTPLAAIIREEHPTSPVSPYGLQKLGSETYGRLFAQTDGFEFIALRLFNVYGPRQRPDSAYAGVLARFVSAFAEDRDITLFGDGRQTRDFVAVTDVARAFRAACEIPLPGRTFVCNVGTSATATLLDVIAGLRLVFPRWKGRVHFQPPAAGDIRNSLADVSRMQSCLGLRAETALHDGLRQLAEWWLAQAPAPALLAS